MVSYLPKGYAGAFNMEHGWRMEYGALKTILLIAKLHKVVVYL